MTRLAHRVVGPVAVLLIALNVPVYAWNARGHMMVAAVAYDKLTQTTKNRVQTLLMLNPDFEEISKKRDSGTAEDARTH